MCLAGPRARAVLDLGKVVTNYERMSEYKIDVFEQKDIS